MSGGGKVGSNEQQSTKKPDYKYWCQLTHWWFEEAVWLLNDWDPEIISVYNAETFRAFAGFMSEGTDQTYEILSRATTDGDLESSSEEIHEGFYRIKIKPLILINWAKGRGIQIPKNLERELNAVHNYVPVESSPYLNPNHEFYSGELHIAVQAWVDLYANDTIRSHRGHKQQAKKWLRKNHSSLSEKAIDRIATVINPKSRKRGGSIPIEYSDSVHKKR